jgi:hypothetical protein
MNPQGCTLPMVQSNFTSHSPILGFTINTTIPIHNPLPQQTAQPKEWITFFTQQSLRLSHFPLELQGLLTIWNFSMTIVTFPTSTILT